MDNYALLILLSGIFFGVSSLFVHLFSRSSFSKYFLDEPDKRKMHQLQIPRIGGVAILVAYATVLLVLALISPDLFNSVIWNPTGKAIGFAAILIFILGFFDDSIFVTLNVPIKFGVQFIIAIGVVYIFGISFEDLRFMGKDIPLGEIGRILTIFWIVGVTNALNIIDGIDGLSASVTIVSLTIASIVLALSGHSEILFVVLPLISVILGFLVHNYPPARLFAGDTGSLFFGSLVAILSVKVAALGSSGGESLAAFYVAAFPVLEVWVSMVRRFVYAQRNSKNMKDSIKRMVTPDNLHMHHRLIFKGYTHEQALRFLIFFAVSISSIAIILVLIEDSVLYKSISIIYSMFFLLMILRRLEYGKRNYLSDNSGETIRRVIAITGESDYFEHSLRHFSRNKYWIARFERISDIMGRRVDSFVVYNEDEDRIHVDIQRALDIRSSSDRPLFFITDVDKDTIPELRDRQIYFIKKPVDMPYLMHDIEKIIAHGGEVTASDIDNTLTIEGTHVTES